MVIEVRIYKCISKQQLLLFYPHHTFVGIVAMGKMKVVREFSALAACSQNIVISAFSSVMIST